MKLPWSRKKEPDQLQTMSECLASDRPDLTVSIWLQNAFERYQNLPSEIEVAYLSDRFLSEINSGGVVGLLNWEADRVSKMPLALSTIGMNDLASVLEQIVHESRAGLLDPESASVEAFDQLVMSQSREIEEATHQHIRRNIEKFV